MNIRFTDYQLSEEIIQALAYLHYEVPTEVQRKVIPAALERKDLIVKAQTGSGKTASFAIPLCDMVEWEENKPQALILTPTRELAAQVKEDFSNIGRLKRVKATAIYGKQPFAAQKLELKQKTHIVVGTPGRVLDHIEKGTLVLDKLKYFVIDEVDEMLSMGFIEQVEAILQALPTNRMTMVFSATLPKNVETLCHAYLNNPVEIIIPPTEHTEARIEHSLIGVREEEKYSILRDITTVENPDSCMIFCRTQEQVDTVWDRLDHDRYSCDEIHGGMMQEDRFSVMNDFKRGKFRYLVATDVAARGIDIENITLVINYDLPLEKEGYVHRTGRTGRAGKSGKAITFLTPYEEKYIDELQTYLGFEIPRRDAPSKEEVARCKAAFDEKMDTRPVIKQDKNAQLNQEIMKLYFNGGKNKKMRAVDFVGTIAKIPGVTAEDIGIITIQDHVSYVDILNGKGPIVLEAMEQTTIKGKRLKVKEAYR